MNAEFFGWVVDQAVGVLTSGVRNFPIGLSIKFAVMYFIICSELMKILKLCITLEKANFY